MTETLTAADLSLVVAFDNVPGRGSLATSWGFSCLLRGPGLSLLFDTGGDGAILLGNLQRLGIDPLTIDRVVLSHAHHDHAGGLDALLAVNPGVEVFVGQSFPAAFKDRLRQAGVALVEVAGPRSIQPGVTSTGELGAEPREQSLVLHTDQGLVLITGCAHPGIVDIVEQARALHRGAPVRLALGGFHLRDLDEPQLQGIVARLRELGVSHLGPSHCTGDRAREVFRDAYAEACLELGVGAELVPLGEFLG